MSDEHPLKPFYSVLVLAFACSALVAVAAVGLRPLQEANKTLDQKKNILNAAGIYQPDQPVDKQFEAIETRIINLDDGSFVPRESIDPENYNQLAASLTDEGGTKLSRSEDPAGIRRLEHYSLVYLVKKDGQISEIVLPVRGKGLWSTMYAYVAIDSDLTTIRGISFYEHGETPGLGGEVENPRWEAGWKDKKLYAPDGDLKIEVVKNSSQSSPEEQPYLVDGISGASLTSQGVENLMRFWFGNHGFQPFFKRIKDQGGFNG